MKRITLFLLRPLLLALLQTMIMAAENYSPETDAKQDRIVERSEDYFIKSLLPDEAAELKAANKKNIEQLMAALKVIDMQIAWITENLENASTPGYKRIVTLRDFPVAKQQGNRSLPERDFTQGALAISSNKFDIAITGPGMFKLQDAQGFVLYRRWGSFRLNKDQIVEDLRGNILLPKIRIPEKIEIDTFSVNDTGQVTVTDTNGKKVQLGSLKVFDPASKLQYLRDCNCFSTGIRISDKASEADPSPVGWGFVQGFIEMSNSDPNNERTSLIVLLRHRRALTRALRLMQASNIAN